MFLWLVLSQCKQMTYFIVIKIGSFSTWISSYIYYIFKIDEHHTMHDNMSRPFNPITQKCHNLCDLSCIIHLWQNRLKSVNHQAVTNPPTVFEKNKKSQHTKEKTNQRTPGALQRLALVQSETESEFERRHSASSSVGKKHTVAQHCSLTTWKPSMSAYIQQ